MNELKEIVIDGNEIFDFIKVIKDSKEIEDIELRNCEITKEDLIKLSEIKEYERIAFINCMFENEKLIERIKTKSLSFTDTKIANYDFLLNMYYLERLTIIGSVVDCTKLNNLINLEYLRISNGLVENLELLELNKIKYLFIDDTNIKDLSFINKFTNLELLSLSENQIINNKDLIVKLSKNIKIIQDSIIEIEVISNE